MHTLYVQDPLPVTDTASSLVGWQALLMLCFFREMCTPKLGSLYIDPNYTGDATYTPQSTKHGRDLFSYQVTDSNPVTQQSVLLLGPGQYPLMWCRA